MMIFLAASLTFLTFLIHTFSGGKAIARPLLASASIDPPVKWLSYYCWHIATLLLLAMAIGFAWIGFAGTVENSLPLLILFGGMSAAMSLLSIWVATKGSINPIKFPSTTLFALIAAVTAMAIAGY